MEFPLRYLVVINKSITHLKTKYAILLISDLSKNLVHFFMFKSLFIFFLVQPFEENMPFAAEFTLQLIYYVEQLINQTAESLAKF